MKKYKSFKKFVADYRKELREYVDRNFETYDKMLTVGMKPSEETQQLVEELQEIDFELEHKNQADPDVVFLDEYRVFKSHKLATSSNRGGF